MTPEKKKANPGDVAWVVARKKDGEAYNIYGYIFLAKVIDFVILMPFRRGLNYLGSIMMCAAMDTCDNHVADLAVFPAVDCYLTSEEALAALRSERTKLFPDGRRTHEN